MNGDSALLPRDGYRVPAARMRALPGPWRWPVAGNMLQLAPGAVHRTLEDWALRYGPVYRMRFGAYRALGISHPGLIELVLRHRPLLFSRSPRISGLINELGFQGVFTAEGETWRRQRKMVMRALTPEAIRAFFPVILAVTRRLEARWRAAVAAGRQPDIARDLKCYSIDVTTWLAMGVDIDTLNDEGNRLQADVETWFATVGRRLPRMFSYWRYVKLAQDRRSDAAVARIHVTVDAMIAGARAGLDADPARRARPRNIIDALVAARDEPGSGFSDEDVRGNVAVMLFAGEDTTANAMCWLLYHLASEPPAAAAAAASADALLGAATVMDRFAGLAGLAYLEAAAVESMRLKPIAPVQSMYANVDLQLAGLHVPRGTLLFLLPRVQATHAQNFPDPLRFAPQRWMEGARGDRAHGADAGGSAAVDRDGKGSEAPGIDAQGSDEQGGEGGARTMFPFGGGPRYCPGRYLAMVEMKMVIAMVLRNFQVQLDGPADAVHESLSFTMAPARLPLRLVLRPPALPAAAP